VVKGGAALLLRLDPNRTSNDIDLAYVAEAGGHAVAVKALEEAMSLDLGDFFTFELCRDRMTEIEVDHPLERALAVPVTARIGERVFVEFSIDLALPREDKLAIEWLKPEVTLTGEPAVDTTAPIAALALSSQVADKACAIFEIHGDGHHSSRARDLADIAMIASQKDFDGTELEERLRAEERRRLDAGTLASPLPVELDLPAAQIAEWRAHWKKATREAPVSFGEAKDQAAAFIDPVLAGVARGRRWDAARQRWC